MLIFAAVFELFALNDPALDNSSKFENYPPPNFRGTVAVSVTPESAMTRRQPDSFTSGQNDAEFYPPFTCTEMRIIDEIELLGETVDCD
jgi:hypothetical protein